MRRLKLYTAVSLDGYIAGPNGEIDWLDVGGDLDYGYAEFYESIDTTLMGSLTYRVALSVPDFPYPDKTNYVFTRSPSQPDTEHVRFVSGDIAGFVRSLKEEPGEGIWLVGGGQINTIMLNAGLIDEVSPDAVPPGPGPRYPAVRAGRGALPVRDDRLRDLRDGSRAVADGEDALRSVEPRGEPVSA